jgi:predicted MFS family arabinose efflux permease
VIAVGLVLARRFLPPDRPPRGAPRARLDVTGLVLLAAALAGILLGLSNLSQDGGIGHAGVLGPLLAGVVVLAVFAWWALRPGEHRPVVNIRLLAVRSLGSASAVLFTAGAAMYAGLFLLPLYYQDLRGEDVLVAALLLIPQGVGSLLTRTVAGRLTDRIGARTVGVAGFALTALATVPFAFAGPGTSMWWLGAVQLVRGLGLGIVLIPVMTVAFADIDAGDLPDASMITRISQQVGGSFGVAVAAVVLESVAASSHSLSRGFGQAFWWTVGFTVVAALASFFLPGRRAPEVIQDAGTPSANLSAKPSGQKVGAPGPH